VAGILIGASAVAAVEYRSPPSAVTIGIDLEFPGDSGEGWSEHVGFPGGGLSHAGEQGACTFTLQAPDHSGPQVYEIDTFTVSGATLDWIYPAGDQQVEWGQTIHYAAGFSIPNNASGFLVVQLIVNSPA